MLEKCNSLIIAEYVLDQVINSPLISNGVCAKVECYQNGREQGFQITGLHNQYFKAIAWAESRNSDAVVVYYGDATLRSISEDAYRNAACFDDADSAATFIASKANEWFVAK